MEYTKGACFGQGKQLHQSELHKNAGCGGRASQRAKKRRGKGKWRNGERKDRGGKVEVKMTDRLSFRSFLRWRSHNSARNLDPQVSLGLSAQAGKLCPADRRDSSSLPSSE